MTFPEQFHRRLHQIAHRPAPPSPEELTEDVSAAVETMSLESSVRRPVDDAGRPGGLVFLRPDLPLVVLPDIHGRVELLTTTLATSFPEVGIDSPLLEALDSQAAQLLMLGDYVHGEARVRERWIAAFGEFQDGFSRHQAMDDEMNESLGVLQVVSLLKTAYPDRVHGLKGNHENIANEEGHGNHPFGKFVYEGAMVQQYMERFYDGRAFEAVYDLEKSFPLLAVGNRTVVSHAEPARFFGPDEIRNYHSLPEVIEGLTWTDNDAAEEGSVERTLSTFLPQHPLDEVTHLGGHRPVKERYALRADGRYVQFHNPSRLLVALPPSERRFDPDRDIREL